MAIVEMKRINLLGLKADEQAILATLQKLACVQVTPLTQEEETFTQHSKLIDLSALDENILRLSWAIGRLAKFDKTKTPLLGGKPNVSAEEVSEVLAEKADLIKIVEALEALERESGEIRGKTTRIQAMLEQLEPWKELTLPIHEIQSTRNTIAMLGTMQKMGLEEMQADDSLPSLCLIQVVSTARDLAYVYIVMHRSVQQEVLDNLRKANFTQVNMQNISHTVAQKMQQQQQRLAVFSTRQEEIVQETAAYANVLPKFKILFDALNSKREQVLFSQGFLSSARTFFLHGWVPASMEEKVESSLKKIAPSVSVEYLVPAEEDEPPVLLHNNTVVSPFETIVSGFSLPNYKALDPTAIMMPFFVNFMGMMVSDAGYGLLMAILIPLMIKFLKPSPGAKNLMKILAWGGVATVVWGALFNTWFGFGPLPSIFDPVNNPMPVMAVCIALGALHLFVGLGVGAYMNIKRGDPLAAIADQVSWFLLIVGLALMLVIPTVGQWVALTGVVIILCTSGREKSNNPFKRLISGLGALYGATGWISDLLSYMRLFGMGLATGVIGMVFNKLVGMVFSAGPIGWILGIVLFVFCHLFNAGINILGAYVHSCRLQYIEFFGKFYDDGGKPFVPLRETNRYVYIQDTVKES